MKQNLPSIYPQNIFNGQAVNLNAPTSFGHLLPVGPGVYEAHLRIAIALTVGTASGPIANGILNFIRQILWKADNGEVFVDNLPARALVEIANVLAGTMPRFDQIAAASATYRLDIPIYFAEPLGIGRTQRTNDFVLDTSRYNSHTFDLVTGPLTDLFTSPGTATVAITADLDWERSKYEWNSTDPSRPNYNPIMGYMSYSGRAPVDANVVTEILLERAADISYKRLFVHASTSGVGGSKFYGVNSDAIIDKLTVSDTDETHVKDQIWAMLQDRNKRKYQLESVRSGVNVLDFTAADSGSNLRALQSNRNGLKLSWTNQAGVGANSYVTVITQAWRDLRPSRKQNIAQAA